MRRPSDYTKFDNDILHMMSRKDIKIYLQVLQDESIWNNNLKYAVSCGDVVVEQEIRNVKGILSY